jgi:hypothetical protein
LVISSSKLPHNTCSKIKLTNYFDFQTLFIESKCRIF